MQRALLLSLALVLAAVPARGDPIIITGGSLDIVPGNTFGDGTMSIRGTGNFALTVKGEAGGLGVCNLCSPEAPVIMGGSFGEELFDGTLVVNGHTFPIPSFEADIALFVDAPDVTAPPIRAEAVLSAPFRLRGSVEIFDFENVPTTTIAITGRGRITTHFVGLPQGAPYHSGHTIGHTLSSSRQRPSQQRRCSSGTGLVGLLLRRGNLRFRPQPEVGFSPV